MSYKPLGDIITVKGGKRLPKGHQLQSAPNIHPYIRVRDMGQRFIPRHGLEYVPDEVFPKILRYIVNTNDVIISIVGTIGLVSVIDDFFDNASQTENCAKLTGLDRNDALFLYYYLISEIGQQEIKFGTVGAVQAKLPLYNIEKINVFWPERNIREEVVEQLSTLDSKIELNRQTNRTLEAIAQAIFKSWFVDFDPVKAKMAVLESGGSIEDAELATMSTISSKSVEELADLKQNSPDNYQQLAQTAALFPSAMQESELGEIPEGWESNCFSQIARLDTSSVNPSKEPDSIWEHYSIPAFDSSKSPVFEKGKTIKSSKYKVDKNSVLSSKLNPHFPRTWWPEIIDENRAICSTEFMQFVPINIRHRPFIYSMITSAPFQRSISERVTGSTGSRQRAQPSQVASMLVKIPLEELLNQYSQRMAESMALIAKNIRENSRLAEIRNALLPELLAGKTTRTLSTLKLREVLDEQ